MNLHTSTRTVKEAKLETVALFPKEVTGEQIKDIEKRLLADGHVIIGMTEEDDPRGFGFLILSQLAINNN